MPTSTIAAAPDGVEPIGNPLTSSFVEVGGAQVHFVRTGSGPPLVLLHGLTGSVKNWRKIIPGLSHIATVYAADLVNMGESQRLPGIDASLAATADRIYLWMAALGLEKADIAGHSHGGSVALMLAARHPERVRSLILFAPGNPYSKQARLLVRFYSTRLGKRVARLAPLLPRALQRIAMRRMFGDPARMTEDAIEGYVDGLGIPGTMDHVLAIVDAWSRDMTHLKQALRDVAQVPTLLIWGDRDRAVSLASGIRLHRELKNSDLKVVDGCGHIVFEERPEAAIRLVTEWIAGRSTDADR